MDQVVSWWFTLSNWSQFWHTLLFIVIARAAQANRPLIQFSKSE